MAEFSCSQRAMRFHPRVLGRACLAVTLPKVHPPPPRSSPPSLHLLFISESATRFRLIIHTVIARAGDVNWKQATFAAALKSPLNRKRDDDEGDYAASRDEHDTTSQNNPE